MTGRVSMAARSNSQLAQGEVNKILIRTFGLRAGDLTIDDESCTVRASVSELTLLHTGSMVMRDVSEWLMACQPLRYMHILQVLAVAVISFHGIMAS